ncbi:hypothetical protein BVRB_7g168140 isoform C [Beta vulgaris subsp. vulgaris]|uniref:Uncharacterized protein n=1 Tax=Beta vulgaris subsp. vulgaris TaxID=3555 RepID=A0A0J8BVE8_BETVV|nr:hypothetical protein BVRB_7g168140 isoform C [Beta vulgaris subsp. vulgaris]
MLQWMGGSRRKVTTSRKSTQKRQKQYFDQRKQQQWQQDAAFIENNVDGSVTCDQPKRNRSLDILSLLNVSNVAEECKPLHESSSSTTNKATCGTSAEDVDSKGHMRKSSSHAFSVSYHTSTSSPILMTNEQTASESTVPSGSRVPSLQQMGRLSSKQSVVHCTGEDTLNRKSVEADHLESASSFQPSIFDIIGDAGAVGTSEGEQVQEAHVAFSIEGLGKVGTKTPMQSPQHPGSLLNGKPSSFTRAAKTYNSCKIFNTMLDEVEMEVECLMQDDEKPSRHNRLSGDILYASSSTEHDLSTFKDGMQLDGKQWEMSSFYDEDRLDKIWDGIGSSPCSNDYQVDEKCGMTCDEYDATNNYSTWIKDTSNYKFERCLSQSLPRWPEKIPDSFYNLDRDCHLPSFDEPKYPSFLHNYSQQDRFSLKKLDDARTNLTSFSGESYSSAAVGSARTADMPSARQRLRYGKDLNMLSKSNEKEDYEGGMWNTMPPTLRRGQKYKSSRKHTRSGSSHLKSAVSSQAAVNEYDGYCLFEEESPLHKMNSHSGSFFSPFEENQHMRIQGSFGPNTKANFHRSKCSFESSEKDTFREFSSENFAFHQPFCSKQSCNNSFIAKTDYGENSPGACDFEIHVPSSNSSEVFGDTESAFSAPESSAQGSVTEEGGDTTKNQPPCPEKLIQVSTEYKYTAPESRLPTREASSKDYDRSEDGLSQEVIAHASETDADNELKSPTKETNGNIPVLCEQKVKVCLNTDGYFEGDNDAFGNNLKGPEPKPLLIDPCYQLMTVERYVLKLFGVPKGKAAVWNAVKLF